MAEPTQQDLQRWLHDDLLNLARGELWRLVSKPLPEERRTIRSFRALCLRRDIAAMRRVRPDFGVSAIPDELGLHRGFDRALSDVLKIWTSG